MMNKACRIETYTPESGGKNCTILPEVILKRGDVILLAAGTLACVRTLYLRAAALNKLLQFYPCVMSKYDYASGGAQGKLSGAISAACAAAGVKGVIVYLSCAELLTQIDLDRVLEDADVPDGISVRFFKRGPLAMRTHKPALELDEIMSQLPPFEGNIKGGFKPLPVPAPDFAGTLSVLQNTDIYPLLVTPGGCTCSMSLGDDTSADMKFDHTRFSDIELANGCEEETAAGAACGFYKSKAKSAAIIGSAIPEIIGFDYNAVKETVQNQGIAANIFRSCGMEPANTGISNALCLLEENIKFRERNGRLIYIIGYTDMEFGSERPLEVGIKALNKAGFEVEIFAAGAALNGKDERALPAANWVVSSAGLSCAQKMKEDYKVPYVCALPFEKDQAGIFRRRFEGIIKGGADEHIEASAYIKKEDTGKGAGKILLIGEPVILSGLLESVRKRLPDAMIRCAYYAPLLSIKEEFLPFVSETSVIFSDMNELAGKVPEVDVVFADPLFFENLKGAYPESLLISCPDPLISGRLMFPAGWLEGEEAFKEYINEAIAKIDSWA